MADKFCDSTCPDCGRDGQTLRRQRDALRVALLRMYLSHDQHLPSNACLAGFDKLRNLDAELRAMRDEWRAEYAEERAREERAMRFDVCRFSEMLAEVKAWLETPEGRAWKAKQKP